MEHRTREKHNISFFFLSEFFTLENVDNFLFILCRLNVDNVSFNRLLIDNYIGY